MLKKNGTKKDLAYIADRSIINPVCKGHLVCDEEENLLACELLGIGKTKITMMPDGSSAEILRIVSDLMPEWHSSLYTMAAGTPCSLNQTRSFFGNSEDMQASC